MSVLATLILPGKLKLNHCQKVAMPVIFLRIGGKLDTKSSKLVVTLNPRIFSVFVIAKPLSLTHGRGIVIIDKHDLTFVYVTF
jgi:hypothetical protein